jgi:hypothetical protein
VSLFPKGIQTVAFKPPQVIDLKWVHL